MTLTIMNGGDLGEEEETSSEGSRACGEKLDFLHLLEMGEMILVPFQVTSQLKQNDQFRGSFPKKSRARSSQHQVPGSRVTALDLAFSVLPSVPH